MIELVNRQRKIQLPEDLAKFTREASRLIKGTRGLGLAVVFVSDRTMKRLNRDFRGKNITTDVLSFPMEDQISSGEPVHLGDIVISAEQAQRQAGENGLDLETELKQLILHGLLHLAGYDHETDDGEMNARELDLRGNLQIEG